MVDGRSRGNRILRQSSAVLRRRGTVIGRLARPATVEGSGPLCENRPRREINPQAIVPQQACADQDLIAIDKRRLDSNRPAIEWEIDKEDLFLDAPVCRQKRQGAADQLRFHLGS
jgi:hypothetical protein